MYGTIRQFAVDPPYVSSFPPPNYSILVATLGVSVLPSELAHLIYFLLNS